MIRPLSLSPCYCVLLLLPYLHRRGKGFADFANFRKNGEGKSETSAFKGMAFFPMLVNPTPAMAVVPTPCCCYLLACGGGGLYGATAAAAPHSFEGDSPPPR